MSDFSSDQKILLNQGKMLPVMEHFYTIQGEGAHSGRAAYFIRLGGCDVKLGRYTSSVDGCRRNRCHSS